MFDVFGAVLTFMKKHLEPKSVLGHVGGQFGCYVWDPFCTGSQIGTKTSLEASCGTHGSPNGFLESSRVPCWQALDAFRKLLHVVWRS